MDELDLSKFEHSGVNMTGFRLVKPDNDPAFKTAQSAWESLDPSSFKGAGPGSNITVSF